MARVQGKQSASSGGRAGQPPVAHARANHKHAAPPSYDSVADTWQGIKSRKNNETGARSKTPQPKKQSGAGETDGDPYTSSRLERELNDILLQDALAKHVDPSFHDLDDESSSLKTHSIQLATLVLHLQNALDAAESKQKKSHPPEAISTQRFLPPAHLPREIIKTTTITASSQGSVPASAKVPVSSVHTNAAGSSLLQSQQSKRQAVPKPPLTPATAGWAGSPMSVQMASPSVTRLTPILDAWLDEVRVALQKRDAAQIAVDLKIEPPLAQIYLDLSKELRKHYPWGKDQNLETLCKRILPKGDNSWDKFSSLLLEYLRFIRDHANDGNLLKTNIDMKRLLNSLFTSLSDRTLGVLILPAVVSASRALARSSLDLDRRPQLVAQLLQEYPLSGPREKLTFVEDAANIVREAFIKCLGDKSGRGVSGRNANPQGKRVGIYQTGNLCLKLLFECGKLSSATTMFVSIDAQSPFLSHYPAAQRVTYLYYLGRYLFANNHFHRAQRALQAAYDQCHAQALKHRQLILVYLIAANICMARFPSSKLLMRREAADLAEYFLPLCRLIVSGNLSRFRDYLSPDNPHGQWFLRKRILLQLRNRCELLVWRSLARRVFIEVGFPGGEDNKTPFLRLHHLQAAAQWLTKQGSRPALRETAAYWQRAESPLHGNTQVQNGSNIEHRDSEVVDPEFAGMEDAIAETGFDIASGTYAGLEERGLYQGNGDSVTKRVGAESPPSLEEVESIMASLIQQDLIFGFLTHNNPRFAIPGAKTRGALTVGFPNMWEVINGRKEGDKIPGWVKEVDGHAASAEAPYGDSGTGGRVVTLSGARPVGAGAML